MRSLVCVFGLLMLTACSGEQSCTDLLVLSSNEVRLTLSSGSTADEVVFDSPGERATCRLDARSLDGGTRDGGSGAIGEPLECTALARGERTAEGVQIAFFTKERVATYTLELRSEDELVQAWTPRELAASSCEPISGSCPSYCGNTQVTLREGQP